MNRGTNRLFLSWGLKGAVAMGLMVSSAVAAKAQNYPAPPWRHESPVNATIQDLERLARGTGSFNSGRERERYDNAIRHLSQFQNGFYHGAFDSGRLDQAISDVQNVVNHNPLDDRQRNRLWADLSSLRAFRARRSYR